MVKAKRNKKGAQAGNGEICRKFRGKHLHNTARRKNIVANRGVITFSGMSEKRGARDR
jgi:hypothetical protein